MGRDFGLFRFSVPFKHFVASGKHHCYCGLLITVTVAIILKAAEHIRNSSGNAVTGIKYCSLL